MTPKKYSGRFKQADCKVGRTFSRAFLLGTLGLLSGCAGAIDGPVADDDSSEALSEDVRIGREVTAALTASQALPGQAVAVEVLYPSGSSLKEVALSASGTLRLDNSVTVLESALPDETPKGAAVAALGASQQKTFVGVRSRIGSIWSVPEIKLQNSAKVEGHARTSEQVSYGPSSAVTGDVHEHATITPKVFSRRDTLPVSPASSPVVPSGMAIALAPGYYKSTTVNSGGTLNLTSGVYFFDVLVGSQGAKINVDTGSGAVVIYVGKTLKYDATVSELHGDAYQANVLWSYLGTSNLSLSSPLVGTLLAPNADVSLRSTSTPHRGAVFAKDIDTAPFAAMVHAPFASWLGGKIEVSSGQVCTGEAVDVSVVLDPQLAGTGVQLSVMGNPGSTHTIQMPYDEGAIVPVTARLWTTDGTLNETLVKNIVINNCPTAVVKPQIFARPHFGEDEFAVEFEVANLENLEASQTAQYSWDFGDGATATTKLPFAVHSYRESINSVNRFQQFEVAVTVEDPGKPDNTGVRSVTVWNSYVLGKERGQAHLPTKANYTTILKFGSSALGAFGVRNVEPEAVTFTSRRITMVGCAEDAMVQQVLTDSVNITVEPEQTLDTYTAFPLSSVSGACTVQAQFDGATQSGLAVRSVVTWDHPDGLVHREELVSDEVNQLLNAIADAELSESKTVITEEELQALASAGIAKFPVRPGEPVVQLQGGTIEEEVGVPCEVGDQTAISGLYCRPTGKWKHIRGQVANAVKGDTILSKSCGFIAEMMGELQPEQFYSHTGIMTKNREEIRHTTADDNWVETNPEGGGTQGQPTDGMETQAVRFGWPGAVTAHVSEAMVFGKVMFNPRGKRREITGFNPQAAECPSGPVVYPRVVKPPPLEETPEVRATLHEAANKALAMTTHYRYAVYSDARMGDADGFYGTDKFAKAGDGYDGWAGREGIVPAVCSSFIRLALHQAGVTVDGFRPATDLGDTVDLDGNPLPDGLFFYTAEERRAAGDALYNALKRKVQTKLDKNYPNGAGFIDFITDVKDDVAAQMVNCFAFDHCAPKYKDEEGTWHKPGTGIAVSPDDIMNNYDPPSRGGVYGYSEALVYRSGWYSQLHTWAVAAGTGTLTGEVHKDGVPVADARVYLQVQGNDGTPQWVQVLTDAGGKFSRIGVYAGEVSVLADSAPDFHDPSTPDDDEYFSTDKCTATPDFPDCSSAGNAIITEGGVAKILLNLQSNSGNNTGGNDLEQSNSFRNVKVEGSIYVLEEDRCWWGGKCNESGSWPYSWEIPLAPDAQTAKRTFKSGCPDDETRGELEVNTRLLDASGRVEVRATLKMFEGASCGSDDKDGEASGTVEIAGGGPTEGGQRPLHLKASHNGEREPASDDYAETTLSIKNIWRPECKVDDECGSGLVCSDPAGGFCVQCANDSQCGSGMHCNRHQCVVCTTDADCGDGKTCVANSCI